MNAILASFVLAASLVVAIAPAHAGVRVNGIAIQCMQHPCPTEEALGAAVLDTAANR